MVVSEHVDFSLFKGTFLKFAGRHQDTEKTNKGRPSYDVVVAKYNASGNAVWARGAKKTSGDPAVSNSVAKDASGNVFITGYFQSPKLIFGTDTLTNTSLGGANIDIFLVKYDALGNIFLTKYDASGNVAWAQSSGGTSIQGAQSVASDASGNVYVTGYFSGSIAFGTTTLTVVGGNNNKDIFWQNTSKCQIELLLQLVYN